MDMSTIVKIVALDLVAMLAFPASCGQAPCDRPLMSMRLRADDTVCARWPGTRCAASPARLELERTAGGAYVTIPSIGAWNGGYIKGQ